MEKKSETLRQREKAQRDLLELKKMQSGEMDAGPKPSDVALKPQTFKEKKDNFLYHYKYVTLGIIFLVIVATVFIVDIVKKVDYDSKVVVFSYDESYISYNDKIIDYFETLYTDVNGNGKVEIAVVDCSVNPNSNSRYQTLQRLQAAMIGEDDALIYLVDEESLKYFDNLEGIKFFPEENIVELGQDFYDSIKLEYIEVPETKLYAAMRIVDNTLLEGKNKAASKAAAEVLEKLKALNKQ